MIINKVLVVSIWTVFTSGFYALRVLSDALGITKHEPWEIGLIVIGSIAVGTLLTMRIFEWIFTYMEKKAEENPE